MHLYYRVNILAGKAYFFSIATYSKRSQLTSSRDMPKDKSSQLDFKTDYPEYGVRQPLLSSGDVKWNGFSLEHHLQPKLEVSEHYHTEHMISIHLDSQPNQLEIGMDENHQDVRWQPGDIFIVPAYVNHNLAWGHNSEFMILCIEPDLFTQSLHEITNFNTVDLVPQFTKADPLIYQIGLSLKADIEAGYPTGKIFGESAATMLAARLLQQYSVRTPKLASDEDGLSSYTLRQVLDYIRSHLSQDLSIVDLAQVAGMSPYYFLRLFKKSMHVTPRQYIIQIRLDRAKELLRSRELSIADIAIECGFTSQSHFTNVFRQITDTTPKAYRRDFG
jgi:AraC family transcriptional regulator